MKKASHRRRPWCFAIIWIAMGGGASWCADNVGNSSNLSPNPTSMHHHHHHQDPTPNTPNTTTMQFIIDRVNIYSVLLNSVNTFSAMKLMFCLWLFMWPQHEWSLMGLFDAFPHAKDITVQAIRTSKNYNIASDCARNVYSLEIHIKACSGLYVFRTFDTIIYDVTK